MYPIFYLHFAEINAGEILSGIAKLYIKELKIEWITIKLSILLTDVY